MLEYDELHMLANVIKEIKKYGYRIIIIDMDSRASLLDLFLNPVEDEGDYFIFMSSEHVFVAHAFKLKEFK